MATEAFIVALQGAALETPRRLGGLESFAFVSETVVPPLLGAARAAGEGEPGAEERLDALCSVVEAGFSSGEDDIVDALAMRLVERHLCRDRALLALVEPHLGPQTRRVVVKIAALIAEADRRVAAATQAQRS